MATSEKESDQNQPETDEKILEIARDRFKLSEEHENEFRKQFLDDLKFLSGEQWPEGIKRDRDADGRPSLVINKLPQYVRQITNDQRQNRPSIKVSPVDDNADVDTAKILQGMVRHIEYNSSADTAYDTAFEGAVSGGRGFFRIMTDYCDPTSFEQDIIIKRVRDHLSVYMDPFSTEPDGSDQAFCFVVDQMSKDEFKRAYPKAELSGSEQWETFGVQCPDWVKSDGVRIAEYYYLEYKSVALCQLQDKSVLPKDQVPEGTPVLAERETQIPVVKWCKLNGVEILEKREQPGKFIPIVPVFGNELYIDGKRILEGVVRHAKDPQRMYNYWASSETEMIALSPRAPVVGYAGQFEGFESKWALANKRNFAYLEVNPTMANGQPAPLPQRMIYEPPVQAITNARLQSSEDIKATTGIYDAAMGARSNETSGRAIERRSLQAQTSNYHFMDNLSRSIRHGGRIIIDWIPIIYDTERAIRSIGEDGQEQVVQINKIFQEGGQEKIYQMGIGKYDVTVDTGPSFATKRQEAASAMLDFTRANPQAPIWDLLVKNMDWPGANEIAERLRKVLPPGLADDKDKKPIPPEVQAQMQQMDQLIQQLTEQLNHKSQQIENGTIELESKERIEFAKIQANVEIELAKMGSKEAIVMLQQEVAQIEQRLQLLHINEPIEQENEPEAGGTPAMAQESFNPTGGASPGESMGDQP